MKKEMRLLVLLVAISGVGLLYYNRTDKTINLPTPNKVISKSVLYDIKEKIDEAGENYSNEFIVKNGDKYGILYNGVTTIKNIEYDLITRLKGRLYYLQKPGLNIVYNSQLDEEIEVDELSIINGRYFKIAQDGKYGLIDENLNNIFLNEYDYIGNNENYLLAYKGDKFEIYQFLDMRKLEIDIEGEGIKLGIGKYLYVINGGKNGVIDSTGKVLIEAKYDTFLPLNDKDILIGYRGEEKYLINLTKGIEKKVEYENFGEESEGVIMILKNGKIGYMSSEGDELITPMYDGGFKAQKDKDFYQLKKDDKWFLAKKDGKIYKELDYDDIGEYEDGLMLVLKNGKFGYIDGNGKVKIPLEFTYAESFKNGKALVAKDSGFGIIDKTGDDIVPFIYDEIRETSRYLFVHQDNKYGLLDKEGHEILPMIYDKLGRNNDEDILFYKKDNETGYLQLQGGK